MNQFVKHPGLPFLLFKASLIKLSTSGKGEGKFPFLDRFRMSVLGFMLGMGSIERGRELKLT